jgi:uncharacterized protein YbjQ (UPF0145 family)
MVMIIVTTDNFSGREYDVIGLVKGSTIQSKNALKDMGQGLKTIVGGELKSYTKMMAEARDIATKRMIDEATNLGADAIVAVRYN